MTPDPPLVRLENLSCSYGRYPVLQDVDLDIGPTDFIGVVGPSGSGKTTLLRALLGTLKPIGGRISRRPGVRVGYVPQLETVDWNFPITVNEAVLMSRTHRSSLPWLSATERAQGEEVLERLGLGGYGRRHIRELSGGQQQRVFLARAMLLEPDLLLLDEPTSGVDVCTRHDVLHLLAELNLAGLAIVLSTHDLNGIAAHLPRLVCLNTTVTAVGSPSEVLTPIVLERTYGAPVDVLEHGGIPVIVDRYTGPWERSPMLQNAAS